MTLKAINKIVEEQTELNPIMESAPVSSDIDVSHIQLTEQEKELAISQAIYQALETKRSNYRASEYWRKVNNPPPLPQFTAEQFLSGCIRRWEKQTGLTFVIDENNNKILQLLSQYFTSDPRFEEQGFSFRKGLYLYGNVGCGKTTIMKMFASNPLSSYIMISARKVASEFTNGGEDGKGGYGAIDRYFGVYQPETFKDYFRHREVGFCFDDMGTETEKQSFGNKSNVLGEILLNRYDQQHNLKNKTHITSNLTTEGIKEYYGERVRSRMREMFNLIEFNTNAKDRRS